MHMPEDSGKLRRQHPKGNIWTTHGALVASKQGNGSSPAFNPSSSRLPKKTSCCGFSVSMASVHEGLGDDKGDRRRAPVT